jgi:hypothetical protein
MAVMAKASKGMLISEVYSRYSLQREENIPFRCKDVTTKLLEKVVKAHGTTSGKYFKDFSLKE